MRGLSVLEMSVDSLLVTGEAEALGNFLRGLMKVAAGEEWPLTGILIPACPSPGWRREPILRFRIHREPNIAFRMF